MSGLNKDVPIPNVVNFAAIDSVEQLEIQLSSKRKPFVVFPDDPEKREKFRKNFENESAIAARTMAWAHYEKRDWGRAEVFKELSRIAAMRQEEGMEVLNGIYATTASRIQKAREQLGGEIAVLIEAGEIGRLTAILKKMKSQTETRDDRLSRIYRKTLDHLEKTGHLVDAEELREAQGGVESDQSNFHGILVKLGFRGLPDKRTRPKMVTKGRGKIR